MGFKSLMENIFLTLCQLRVLDEERSGYKLVPVVASAMPMDRLNLLKRITFGRQVAEDEASELASYFVQTDQWSRISAGQIDIVRGEKGSGKSAIYATLWHSRNELFYKGIVIAAAENLRGAPVFQDLGTNPPTTEAEFVVLWKLYAATLIAQQMRERGIRNVDARHAYRVLEEAKLLEPTLTLASLLRRVRDNVRSIIRAEEIEGGITFDPNSGMPNGIRGRIVRREPTSERDARRLITIDRLFALLDKALREYGEDVEPQEGQEDEGKSIGKSGIEAWVLFDRLDVAFADNHELEANALRALIRAYNDLRNLERISLKIFIREDIWKRLTERGFRELSHIVRYVVLDWKQPALLNLIMRRLLTNATLVGEFAIDVGRTLQDSAKQKELFDSIFPAQVGEGRRKTTTLNWLLTRCADGSGKTAPRELIQLLNCVRDQEIKRLEHGEKSEANPLFHSSVFKLALPEVSNARLFQCLYAEYPNYRPLVEKLRKQKCEQTPDSLAELWALDRTDAIAKATELVSLGFFEERGDLRTRTYWVPFLYRDALQLVQGRAD